MARPGSVSAVVSASEARSDFIAGYLGIVSVGTGARSVQLNARRRSVLEQAVLRRGYAAGGRGIVGSAAYVIVVVIARAAGVAIIVVVVAVIVAAGIAILVIIVVIVIVTVGTTVIVIIVIIIIIVVIIIIIVVIIIVVVIVVFLATKALAAIGVIVVGVVAGKQQGLGLGGVTVRRAGATLGIVGRGVDGAPGGNASGGGQGGGRNQDHQGLVHGRSPCFLLTLLCRVDLIAS
tara:strand:- start:20 stop:721 length:702 start_codon:yes stop_codon:yes gene_type:complete